MRQETIYRIAALALLVFSFTVGRAQPLVRINEILADNSLIVNSDGTRTDLVELHNPNDFPVNISGWSITDSNTNPTRYIFPPSPDIPPFGYRVLIFDSAHSNSPLPHVPFGIKATGGFLHLYDTAFNEDVVEYGLQLEDVSLVRIDQFTWGVGVPSFNGPNTSIPLGSVTVLKINEWFATGNDYFEIYNPSPDPILLGGCYVADLGTAPFPERWHRIPPLSFIGTGEQAYVVFQANGNGDYTTNRYPADQVNFSLGTGMNGDLIALYPPIGFPEIDRITYGSGSQTNDVGQGRLPDGAANIVYFPRRSPHHDYDVRSPGDANYLILDKLWVNEILTHTDPPLEDAVEFQNRAATNINISGWWLSNSRRDRKKYQIPAGAAIPPGGFRVIYEGFNTPVGFNSFGTPIPFTFNSAHGDNVVLSQVDGSGNLTGYIVYEEFEAAANGIAFGHYRTSQTNLNDYKFVALSETTFGLNDGAVSTVAEFRLGTGRTNVYPKIGPLVINEIMYAPPNRTYVNTNGSNVFGQNPNDEYIELRNTSPNAVPLYDPAYPTNHWRLQKAVSFVFPLTNIAANSFFLAVAFNPHTNTAALDDFRARYNVPTDVPIFGPWIGRLSDSYPGGDSIELYRPDPVQLPPAPDAGFVPYIRIDKVNFNSSTNWQNSGLSANGTGNTLQRKSSLAFGNDPTNWLVGAFNAGRATPAGLLDTDGDGMSDGWEDANGFNKFNSADASQDADNDGFTNLGEFLAGTNPYSNASFLKILDIIPFIGTNVPAYVRFLAYSNASYTVEYRNSLLPSSNWQRLGDVPPGPERLVTVPDATAHTKVDRYYRVVAPTTN